MSRNWTPEEVKVVSKMMESAGQMSYDEFNAWMIIANFGKRQKDGDHYCPRCGQDTVKDRLHTNALSRHAEVTICDACGTDEAIRDFTHKVLPLSEWAVVARDRHIVEE